LSGAALTALRLRQLDALGVMPYRLRSRQSAANAARAETAGEDAVAPPLAVRIAVICAQPPGDAAKSIALALGVAESMLHWQSPREGRLPELDQNAAAFLVLGQALARVLGAELPTAAQQAAPVIVTAAPQEWRGNALAKRLLWQALRPLRRQLRAQAWPQS
jgi:hypothetical protein